MSLTVSFLTWRWVKSVSVACAIVSFISLGMAAPSPLLEFTHSFPLPAHAAQQAKLLFQRTNAVWACDTMASRIFIGKFSGRLDNAPLAIFPPGHVFPSGKNRRCARFLRTSLVFSPTPRPPCAHLGRRVHASLLLGRGNVQGTLTA